MGMLDDIPKALDRVPIWKRLGDVPDEIEGLKRRVGELEEKLGGKWPADVCRYCGERAARLYHVFGVEKGIMQEEWKCGSCGQTERRAHKVSPR